MKSIICKRKRISFTDQQEKMIVSGWGNASFYNSILEKITYISDGLKVKGYLCYPTDYAHKKFPCIFWCRGGYAENGVIDEFTAKGIFGRIASEGFVVLSTQYRGNDGGEGMDEAGGRDINDILNLINAANEFDFADSKIWGLEGWSRGGMMVYLTLLKSNKFKCALSAGAITDFKSYIKSNYKLKQIIAGYAGEANVENEILKRTIIDKVELLPDIPYLVIHGGEDTIVPVSQSINFAVELNKFKKTFKLIIFENGDHHIKKSKNEIELEKIKWYNKYLR